MQRGCDWHYKEKISSDIDRIAHIIENIGRFVRKAVRKDKAYFLFLDCCSKMMYFDSVESL